MHFFVVKGICNHLTKIEMLELYNKLRITFITQHKNIQLIKITNQKTK